MSLAHKSPAMLRVVALACVALALGACSKGTSDLEARIAEIKARKGAALEPLPVMKTFETTSRRMVVTRGF